MQDFFFEMKWSNALKGKFLIFVFSDTYGPASFLQNGRLCLQAQVFQLATIPFQKFPFIKKNVFLNLYPSLETLQLVGSVHIILDGRSQ